jgi:ribosome-binding protein aMBF1 (putative translation factor)
MTMATSRRRWKDGSAGELLGLSDAEEAIVELRLRLADEVRRLRTDQGLTQRDLAQRLGSSQSRVAFLEQADASAELMIRALLVLGASRRQIGRLIAA